uniref:Sphingomyelin synthase-like domain-containing protein n=2 Tax=Wuchereria bancrofti TaxID=6293 RepID=A0AAF5PHQ7_WUCBA
MLDGQITTASSATRRICSSSNSEDFSEDNYGDEGRAPLLNGLLSSANNAVKIDLNFSDIIVQTSNNSFDKFPKERCKAAISVGLLITAAVCNDLVLSFIHEKVPQEPPLPDAVFAHTPYIPWALTVSEYLMLASFTCMLALTVLHRHRWIILRRIAVIGSLLYFGRCLTMLVTQVPIADPNYYCSPRLSGADYTLRNIFLRAMRIVSGAGLMINGKHTLCGDYIYSGHTVVLVTSCLFITEYSPRRWKPLHLFSIMVSAAGVVLLLISRAHYTIDVIISYWISTRVFWIYHTLAAFPNLRNASSHYNHLSKFYWYRLFLFMEGNLYRPVPRRFDWPFPRMRFGTRTTCKTNLS